MARNKKPDIEKVAEKLAEMAVRHLSQFSEEEQERRILAAEKLVANASRAGSPRTSSSTPRTRRTRVSARSR
jgi:hypothetical protein